MSDNKKLSPETQKYLDELKKQQITMTILDKEIINDLDSDNKIKGKEFNPILRFIAKIIYRLMLYGGVVLTVLGFVNIYGAYMIYQAYKFGGLIGIVHSKWTFIFIGYIVFMLVYKKIHFALYKYSEGI